MSFNKIEYDNNYTKEHYARLCVLVPKEKKADIENHYKSKGFKSMSEYIGYLIQTDMDQKTEEQTK